LLIRTHYLKTNVLHTWGHTGMHNIVVTATFKLKSIDDGIVFMFVCMTPS